jgi:hypothetical protein
MQSAKGTHMEYDEDKIDEVSLALLHLTSFREHKGDPTRAWKGLDWGIRDRLFDKGYILDPRNKSKSVILTEEGARLSKELFDKHFARHTDSAE